MPRTAKPKSGTATTVTVATFNEADRNMYGGDEMLMESRRKANGEYVAPAHCVNASVYDINRGDIIYIKDPTKKIHFSPVYYDQSQSWSAQDITERLQDGYQFCNASDFSVRPEKAYMWKKNVAGNLAHLGMADKALVMMWIPWDKYLENNKKLTAPSDDIQKSQEERLREAADSARREHGGPYRYENPAIEITTTQEERFVPDRN